MTEQTSSSKRAKNAKIYKVTSAETLNKIEEKYRTRQSGVTEIEPWAINTKFQEIAENVIRDRNGEWKTPLYYIVCKNKTSIGALNLCEKAAQFIKDNDYSGNDIDILSISCNLHKTRLHLKILIRIYSGNIPDIKKFFEWIGDNYYVDEEQEVVIKGNLIVPDEIKNFKYTNAQLTAHDKAVKQELEMVNETTPKAPLLNQLKKYVPRTLPRPEDRVDMIYDLQSKDAQIKTISTYAEFNELFHEILTHINTVDYLQYINSMEDDKQMMEFLDYTKDYVKAEYIATGKMHEEDLPAMMDKLNTAMYKMYILQDFIDDPEVTDIKVTAPNSIRVRVHGNAYSSNVNFMDVQDYLRFVRAICIRNHVNQYIPEQTFTDPYDENYILRFSITQAYVNSVPWPYLHIRKVSRQKLMAPDLIKAGMFDERIRDYLLDCGKNSRGVVFAGPPGSGKTVILNWFLEEAYEQSAEILVIQENDELFAYRKGVMFQHVVNHVENGLMQTVSLEQLGQLALVAGANVFIIGEAKGAEICSAITLSNSGCRTAITIHSQSSTETIDKMADLAMRGFAKNMEQAKRMLQSFQTIVYLKDFKVQEISEITGFDETTKNMKYNYIYRRDADDILHPKEKKNDTNEV